MKQLPEELQIKVETDMALRLTAEGLPRHPDNDYERHLYARYLCQHGQTRAKVRAALFALGLTDVPQNKRFRYVDDVLNSILVGFEQDNPLPVFEAKGE